MTAKTLHAHLSPCTTFTPTAGVQYAIWRPANHLGAKIELVFVPADQAPAGALTVEQAHEIAMAISD